MATTSVCAEVQVARTNGIELRVQPAESGSELSTA